MESIRRWAHALVTLNGTPHGIAAGFAFGASLSLIPIPFLGMFVALALAPVLKMNLPATYAGTLVVNPFTGPVIYSTDLVVGATVTGQAIPAFEEMLDYDWRQWLELARETVPSFLVGGLILSAVGGSLGYALVRLAVTWWRREKKRSPLEEDDRSSPNQGPD